MSQWKIDVKDITAERKEFYFKPPRLLRGFLESLIKDPRDVPILYLLFNIALFTLPGAYLVFSAKSNIVGFIFWIANVLLFQERFLIGLHYYSHRGFFKNDALNAGVALLISPFFGMPSGLYYLHHVVMHHSENNTWAWDLSSTERFQRDNVLHFLAYWLRFLCLVWFELPHYAFRRGRYVFAACSSFAVVCFFLVLGGLFRYNPCGAFWVFIFPTFVNSILLMLGNWSQHIFVDPSNPRSNYHLTYNVINDECNQRSFNDGYHVEHHINSRRHWSELPSNFLANLDRYAKEDAIIFERLDPMKVSFCY
jgi:fatty acid desaturase